MKKIIAIIICSIIAFTFAGCDFFVKDYYPEFESGYFKYAVKTEEDGTKKAYLVGFTESGSEQEVLIYPNELDGIKVCGMGYDLPHVIGTQPVGSFESENLKKFYIPRPYSNNGLGSVAYQAMELPDCEFVVWHKYSNSFNQSIFIYGYNKYISEHVKESNSKLANVSYLYNYEDAPNDGYYWVDSYNETTISFIPPEPEREGYEFGGWYKEPECENVWIFETDIVGEEIVIRNITENYDVTQKITNLYAKWISK